MGYWIYFYNRQLDGTLGEGLGTDACHRLDGRLGLGSAIQEGYDRAYNLRKVQRYEAFKVMTGPYPSKLRPVTGLISTNLNLKESN